MKKEYKYPYRAIKIDGKAKLVHRHVMEHHIGRKLLPSECVHHKDGDGHNNDISNLEIMSRSAHAKHHQKSGELRPPPAITDERKIEYCERMSSVSKEQAFRIKYSGEKASVLTKELGITKFTVNRIRSGTTWKHI
jgi:hypothetical protein